MSTEKAAPHSKVVFRGDGQKPLFMDSFTATKAPKPGVKPTQPGILERMRRGIWSKADEEKAVEDAQTEIERQQRAMRELAAALRSRTGDRDRAAKRLRKADEQHAALKARRESLTAEVTQRVWGVELPPGTEVDVHYSRIASMDLALADFPKVRAILADTLAKAEQALATFREENELGSEED